MIFLTVGTQLPFDRLVKVIDDWAKQSDEEVVAQIGDTSLIANNMITYKTLTPSEYEEYFKNATIIISHAGMGTIIKSLLANKPIILMARNAEKGEHRNNHQIDTIAKFRNTQGCYVADDENSLIDLLRNRDKLKPNFKNIDNNDFNSRLLKLIYKL